MNTKSKKLNANNIINARKKLDNELKRKWSIMKSENTLRKSAVKTCRLHNLATIHNQILQNIEKRIIVKGILNNINNGISTFNTEEFKKSHYYTIFRLQETREQITKLNEIREMLILFLQRLRIIIIQQRSRLLMIVLTIFWLNKCSRA